MNADKLNELRQLIEFLKQHQIASFEFESGDEKVRLSFQGEPAGISAGQLSQITHAIGSHSAPPAAPAPAAAPPPLPATESAAPAPATEANLHTIVSPMVGTFYESPTPGAPAFVKPGDQIEPGQTLCIVEAMKLMNDIESDVAGEIVKRLVTNGQPVEYGQSLFTVRLRA